MQRYILTGTPGSGKTSIIRALEMTGASVVSEAATDVISYKQMQNIPEPWKNEDFIDDVITLQKHRQINLFENHSNIHFYDRSPICTYALAVFLGYEPSNVLMNEIDRISKDNIYESRAFFIDNLGFIETTEARKITFEESLKFEQIHLESYKKFGYELIHIPPASVQNRVNFILEQIK